MNSLLLLLALLFALWFPLVENSSLDHVLSTALCMARCSDEQCRQICKQTTDKPTQIPLVENVTAANVTLQCKDVDRLVLKHNVGIYVIEKRKNRRIVWSNPVVSRDGFVEFSKLQSGTRYQFRVREITAEGVAAAETTKWFETHTDGYIPAAVNNVSIGNFKVNKNKPGRMQAHLSIEPADDRNCLYDVVFWSGRHNLHQYRVDAIREFGLKLEYVDYNSDDVVYVISRNDVGDKQSENFTLTFRTPSCLDIQYDLTVCAPPRVTGLRVIYTESAEMNPAYFRVAWDKPTLLPDNYTVIVEPMDSDNFDSVDVTVAGNQSTADVQIGVASSRRYRIGVVAESAGGSSFQSTLFTKSDQPIGAVEFQVVIPIVIVTSLSMCLTIAYFYYRSKINVAKTLCKYSVFEGMDRKGTFDDVIAPRKSLSSTRFYVNDVKVKDKFEIPLDRLTIKTALGSGIGGLVKLATLQNGRGQSVNVAVKMLRDEASENDLKSFQREISLMKSIGNHKNIVSLIGCCTLDKRPLLIVEYCDRGDLQTYLRTILSDTAMDIFKSKKIQSQADALSFPRQGYHNVGWAINNYLYDIQQEAMNGHNEDLLNIARQIANGMEFLSSNRIVHRDLAARNVLVCADKTVKISDFGLSRDIYQENVYKKQSNDKLPLKWMAIESLAYTIYTTYSDVWSFGILLYEIVTLGGNPYPEWHSSEILHLLQSGYRMKRPSSCGFELYEIMLSCWRENPLNRPTFSQLKRQLAYLNVLITGGQVTAD